MERFTRRSALRRAAAGSLVAGSSGGLLAALGESAATAAAAAPKRGGTLNIGFIGGGSGDTIDPSKPVANVDYARVNNLYEGLVRMTPKGLPALNLASEITPNKTATEWTIRVHSGVTFHN